MKFTMLEYWEQFGYIHEIHDVKIVRNKNGSNQLVKKFEYDNSKVPNYFELTIKTKKYIILDIDLNCKENQKILSSGYDLNTFRKIKNVMYLEKSMRGGIHMLIQVDDSFDDKKSVCKNILIGGKKYKLYIELKNKCLVSPSRNYDPIFKKDCDKITTNANFYKLIKKILNILVENTQLRTINDNIEMNDSVDEFFYDNRKKKKMKKKRVDDLGRVVNVQNEITKLSRAKNMLEQKDILEPWISMTSQCKLLTNHKSRYFMFVGQ